MPEPNGGRPGTEILRVERLTVAYGAHDRPAVEDVTFQLRRGELFGLVGESGSGKTTTAMAVLRLIKPPGRIVTGSVHLGDVELLCANRQQLRRLRWSDISLVPQGAMNALAPLARVGVQIGDTLRAHERRVGRKEVGARIEQLLAAVQLEPEVARMYPHELSGGMKQRVCIAMAIALNPKVVVADEPTSALDVVVQRTVAETLASVQRRLGMSVLLIGHDLALQAQLADRIGVMWQGRLVELAPVRAIFRSPAHPYTQLLLRAIPSLRKRNWQPQEETSALRAIAQRYLDDRVALRPVGDDHLAAVP